MSRKRLGDSQGATGFTTSTISFPGDLISRFKTSMLTVWLPVRMRCLPYLLLTNGRSFPAKGESVLVSSQQHRHSNSRVIHLIQLPLLLRKKCCLIYAGGQTEGTPPDGRTPRAPLTNLVKQAEPVTNLDEGKGGFDEGAGLWTNFVKGSWVVNLTLDEPCQARRNFGEP